MLRSSFAMLILYYQGYPDFYGTAALPNASETAATELPTVNKLLECILSICRSDGARFVSNVESAVFVFAVVWLNGTRVQCECAKPVLNRFDDSSLSEISRFKSVVNQLHKSSI